MGVSARIGVLLLAVLAVTSVPSVLSASVRADASYAMVKGCGDQDRLCVAVPSGCTTDSSCTLVVTARKDPDDASKYRFDMAAQRTAYVAVALAKGSVMGNDSVVECIFDPPGKVLVYMSVNSDHKPATGRRGNTRLGAEEQKGVTLVDGKLENGVISCSFRRDKLTKVSGTDYDLDTGSWHLQAAAGDKLNNDTTIYHHMQWVVSSSAVKLSAVGLQDSSGKAPSGAAALSAAAVTVLAALSALCVV